MFPQLVAIEKAQKGQAVRKFLKAFYNTPSLIQGNSEYLAQPKINSIYKLFTSSPLLYLPFHKAFEQTKLQRPSLNSHENGVLAGDFFKKLKYVYKRTSHLVAVGNVEIKRGCKTFLYLIALGKAKPYPYFQKLPPESKKKKPLSRRVIHALIAAIFSSYLLFLHQGTHLCTLQVLLENPSFP